MNKAINKTTISITTAADGSATVYSEAIYGLLYAVNFVKGTLADTADLTVSTSGGGFDNTILTLTNLTTSNDGVYYPRADNCDSAGAVSTGAGNVMPLLDGTVKVVVAEGGNAVSGSVVLSWIDAV